MALTLKGLEGLQAQLESVGEEMRTKLLRGAMRKAFAPVLEEAKARVPVDRGELREGLVMGTAKGRSDTEIAAGVMVVPNSTSHKQARMAAAAFGEAQSDRLPAPRYWHFIEFGTSRQAPQPFLRPALEANQQKVIDGLSTELRKKVRNALKRQARKASKR
ncbi:MAG TPA: HK97-gp10 family putative phage morphogenesis protein [Archangium sp.]